MNSRRLSLLCAASIAATSITTPAAEARRRERPPSEEQIQAFLADKPAELQQQFRAMAIEGDRNRVLNLMRTGLAAMELGRHDLAAGAFEEALQRIETIYADNPDAERARSTFVAEAAKDFKGENYERVMAYYYRGVLFMLDGDYENARASFQGGQLQDMFAEDQRYAADVALFDVLSGFAAQCSGNYSLAQEDFERARQSRPGIAIPGRDDRMLLLADVGGPVVKASDGEFRENLRFQAPQNPVTGVSFSYSGPASGSNAASDYGDALKLAHALVDRAMPAEAYRLAAAGFSDVGYRDLPRAPVAALMQPVQYDAPAPQAVDDDMMARYRAAAAATADASTPAPEPEPAAPAYAAEPEAQPELVWEASTPAESVDADQLARYRAAASATADYNTPAPAPSATEAAPAYAPAPVYAAAPPPTSGNAPVVLAPVYESGAVADAERAYARAQTVVASAETLARERGEAAQAAQRYAEAAEAAAAEGLQGPGSSSFGADDLAALAGQARQTAQDAARDAEDTAYLVTAASAWMNAAAQTLTAARAAAPVPQAYAAAAPSYAAPAPSDHAAASYAPDAASGAAPAALAAAPVVDAAWTSSPVYSPYSPAAPVQARTLAGMMGEDVFWQARTRGGREVDGILAGKANFKQDATAVADATGVAAQSFMNTANQMYSNSYTQADYSAANSMAAIGLGMAIFSLASRAAAAAAKPQADIRYWDNLPSQLYYQFSATPASYRADFVGADGAVLSSSEFTTHVDARGACGVAWGRSQSALNISASAPNAATGRRR